MKTLLVIGGSGFFGKSILCSFIRGRLTSSGIGNVVALSRHASRLSREFPQLVNEGVTLIDADITSLTSLPEADCIIYAAASTDARVYERNTLAETDNIIAGAANFCKVFQQIPHHRKIKIVFVSSGAVYGAQPQDVEKIAETFSPENEYSDPSKRAYARAKLSAEKIIKRCSEEVGGQSAIARCFAFVGAWLPRDQHFAIGNFLGDALNKRPIVVKARHPVIRSYMYADDLVDWLMTIADNANGSCPVYNVGSDEAVEIRRLAEYVGTLLGVPVSYPEGVEDETFMDRYVPSIDKAAEVLGLKLSYNVQSALAETVKRIYAM